MHSTSILLLNFCVASVFGVKELRLNTSDCRRFNANQKSLEIDCNDSTDECPFAGSYPVAQVLHLKMKECFVEFVQNIVKMTSNLITVDISCSGYESLDTIPLRQPHLQTLNVSHNIFKQIPADWLFHASNVIELDFSYNSLERIESKAFIDCPNIQRIHLNHNRIAIIADDAFTNLTHLQYVNLNVNRCHWIDMFRNNKQMRTLSIANNPIYNFDCNHFLKMNSITVQISWKDIRYFHTNCQGNQFSVFLNSSISSESILPAQREIYCNEQSFQSIQQFSAGRNKFENIAKMLQCFAGQTLTEIDLSGNFVGMINRTVFARFENLEWISLSDTILLDFDFDMLSAQTSKLESLDLSLNNLTNLLRPEFVRNFTQLKQLIAAECQLRNALEIISNLPSTIEYLDLSGNYVGEISANSFQRLQHLHTLKLNNTQLSWANNVNPFERCEGLRVLDIHDQNSLANVNFTRLSATLYNLIDFNAANCQLENAIQIIKYFSSELEHCDLSGNRLDPLDSETFRTLINLKTLSLSNVGLTSFNPSILQSQQQLRFLNISHNRLVQMTFYAMPKSLVKLDIEWNNLMTIWSFDRAHLPALESVSISMNRLQCSQLHDLKRNWDGLKFSGDPMDQKGGNCNNELRNMIANDPNELNGTSGIIQTADFSSHLQYLFVIVTPIIGIISAGCIGFAIYRQIERFLTSKEEKMDFDRGHIEDEMHEKQTPPNENNCIDHIYEEIDDSIEYDRLRFDTDPMPLMTTGNHYHNVNIQSVQNHPETLANGENTEAKLK